jgi:hypothetical protein
VRSGDQAMRREAASTAAQAASWDDMASRLAAVYGRSGDA